MVVVVVVVVVEVAMVGGRFGFTAHSIVCLLLRRRNARRKQGAGEREALLPKLTKRCAWNQLVGRKQNEGAHAAASMSFRVHAHHATPRHTNRHCDPLLAAVVSNICSWMACPSWLVLREMVPNIAHRSKLPSGFACRSVGRSQARGIRNNNTTAGTDKNKNTLLVCGKNKRLPPTPLSLIHI